MKQLDAGNPQEDPAGYVFQANKLFSIDFQSTMCSLFNLILTIFH